MLAIFLSVIFTTPAAADYVIPGTDGGLAVYADVRLNFWYDEFSEEANNTDESDTDLDFSIDRPFSRFGVKYKTDAFRFNVEMRPWSSSGSGPDDRFVRQWYGSWKFGSGDLLVGQTWTPTFASVSRDNKHVLSSYGQFAGTLRAPQIALKIKGFKLALIEPRETPAGPNLFPPATYDTDVVIPKVEAAYGFKTGPAAWYLFGGYQSIKKVDHGADEDYTINSWAAGLRIKASMKSFYVNGTIWSCQNPRDYAMFKTTSPYHARLDDDSVSDVDALGGALVAGYKWKKVGNFDMVILEAAYGYVKYEQDYDGESLEDPTSTYFVSCQFILNKNVSFAPQVGVVDFMEGDSFPGGDDEDQGDNKYFGVYTTYRF